MSDYKPNENQNNNGEDMQALFDLLGRLEKRDEVRRHQDNRIFSDPAPVDLVASAAEDSEEDYAHLHIDSFEPAIPSDYDIGDLLITPNDNFEDEEDRIPLVSLVSAPEDEDTPAPAVARRNPFAVLWEGFCNNLPRKADSAGTKARKCGFLFSLLVMLVAIVYLAVDLLLIPAQNTKLKNELMDLYHPEQSQVVISDTDAEEGNYPEKMLASFKDLYDRNDEVRGWISYHAYGANKDFLDIEYPIVHSGDNDKYLKKDFDGNKNRNGTLFFDKANKLDNYRDQNRALIVYGHNMASGQMFAGLNKFLGSVNNARAAATLTMSTLYRQDEYLVFAVVLIDESDMNRRSYDMWKTKFINDAEFEKHVEEIRARSVFDYPVDVQADDQLLVLSTCTGKTSAHVKDGRLVVVARRVRDGEKAVVNTTEIVKNKDVIMPYYWYINQKKTPHDYYIDAGLDYPEVPDKPNNSTMHTGYSETTTTTTTIGSGSETSDTVGSGTATDTEGTASTTTKKPTAGTGTKPTAGTTATTKPTTGTTAPTTGTTTPTGSTASTESVDPTVSTDPTESTTPSTESTDPTESTTPSTEPSVEPTEPTEPSVEPTEPTEPSVEPTEPTTAE